MNTDSTAFESNDSTFGAGLMVGAMVQRISVIKHGCGSVLLFSLSGCLQR